MTDEATREGATEVKTEAEAKVKTTSARQAVIDAMVAKRRTEPEARGEGEGEGEEKEVSAAPADEKAPAEGNTSRETQDKAEEDLVTIKVDGKEQRVPRDKIYEIGIRAMQKEVAADARLAEAANMRRQLDLERQAFEQQRESQARALAAQMQQSERDNSTGDHPAKGVDEYLPLAKSALRALFDGEEDEAAQQMAKAWAMGRNSVTPEDLQRMTAEAMQQARLLVHQDLRKEKWNEELGEAVEWFETEHKDIAADAQWRALADRETADLQKQHPDWLPKRIVKEAVKRVIELRKTLPETGGKRRDVKQQIDNPRAASGRVPPPREPAPRTRSQYIQDLRKARGLQR